MTRVLIWHFFTNVLPCKGSLQCTCRCSPPPKKTSFNWTRPYVRGGTTENANRNDKAHLPPDDMTKSTWVFVLAGTVRGSKAVACVVQLTKWWPRESIINRLMIILQTQSFFMNAKCWLKITSHYIFCTWQFEALLASVSLFRKKLLSDVLKNEWQTNRQVNKSWYWW